MAHKYIYIGAMLLLLAIKSAAQPVSGYLGKRFATSLEVQIIPGFQGGFETNTSNFLNIWSTIMDNPFSYVPRYVLNTEYQMQERRSFRGSIGFANMKVPLFYEYQSPGSSTVLYEGVSVQSLQTIFVQLGIRQARKGKQMPISANYIGYGLGFYYSTVDTFQVEHKENGIVEALLSFDKTIANNLTFHVEFGRRVIVGKGFFIDYGVAINLTRNIFIDFDRNSYIWPRKPQNFEEMIRGRVANNSLINLRVALGLFH